MCVVSNDVNYGVTGIVWCGKEKIRYVRVRIQWSSMVINLTNIDLINIFNEKRNNVFKKKIKKYVYFSYYSDYYQFTEITELSRRRFRNSYKTAQGKLNMKL